MIRKILESTRNKPCSCPEHKICTACKAKKVVRPYVYVENPRSLPAPVSITYYNHIPQSIEYSDSRGSALPWRRKKRQARENIPHRQTGICRWYRRRKALRQLQLEYKREQAAIRKKKHDDYVREREKEIIIFEEQKRKTLEPSTPTKKTVKYSPPPAVKLKKYPKKKKERYTYVKPNGRTKKVLAKRTIYKEPITRRFVNFCYRVCCQFYCYLTIILIIAATVMFVL